jgi:hypothetical protein
MIPKLHSPHHSLLVNFFCGYQNLLQSKKIGRDATSIKNFILFL